MISLLAAGSRGDTQPYIALGLALKSEGYDVQIAATENFKNLVEGYGLNFFPIEGDVTKVASSEDIQAAMQSDNPLKMLLSFKTLQKYAFQLQEGFYEACQKAEAVIYHPGASIGYFAAQKLGIPSILASPFPMTPTKEYPALLFYNAPRLGGLTNVLSHKMFEQTLWSTAKAPIKQFWKSKFGTLPESFTSPIRKQQTDTSPSIVSCSEHVFPTPNDWPKNVHNTGYWFADAPSDWQASEELNTFLETGDAPIYVGFGSLNDAKTPEKTTQIVIDALTETGQRGILATGWNGMNHLKDPPKNIFILKEAPHAWLFPQMAAVIHHGGAGTTAAAFRAGSPQIVIPHSVDQFAWGRKVQELGVGAKAINKRQLSSDKLTRAIQDVLTSSVKAAAYDLGQKIQSEDGAKTAVALIKRTLELT